MTQEYITRSPAETEAVGERVGATLGAGDVLCFYGGLGAGKTAMCRGIARGTGFTGNVTSPTFALVNEYRGGSPELAHFDMYRISGEDDLYSTGFYDYLDKSFAVLIEWTENVEDFIGEPDVVVSIEGSGDGARRITVDDRRLRLLGADG